MRYVAVLSRMKAEAGCVCGAGAAAIIGRLAKAPGMNAIRAGELGAASAVLWSRTVATSGVVASVR